MREKLESKLIFKNSKRILLLIFWVIVFGLGSFIITYYFGKKVLLILVVLGSLFFIIKDFKQKKWININSEITMADKS